MPSTTCHFLIGAALALPALQSRTLTAILPRWSIPVAAGLLTAAPDLDLAGKRLFGIADSSLFSHRGVFHSPFFLILFSAALAIVVARGHERGPLGWLWLLWAGCMGSHPLTDSLTNGGKGVMLFLPFSRARVFFAWRPIYTPPSGIEDVVRRALVLRTSEIPFCCAAAAIGVGGLLVRRRLRQKNARESSEAPEGDLDLDRQVRR